MKYSEGNIRSVKHSIDIERAARVAHLSLSLSLQEHFDPYFVKSHNHRNLIFQDKEAGGSVLHGDK